jgi:hypothetical protein
MSVCRHVHQDSAGLRGALGKTLTTASLTIIRVSCNEGGKRPFEFGPGGVTIGTMAGIAVTTANSSATHGSAASCPRGAMWWLRFRRARLDRRLERPHLRVAGSLVALLRHHATSMARSARPASALLEVRTPGTSHQGAGARGIAKERWRGVDEQLMLASTQARATRRGTAGFTASASEFNLESTNESLA